MDIKAHNRLINRFWDLFLAANNREDGHTMWLISEEATSYGYTRFNNML